MKKIIFLFIISIATISCYKDYVSDFTYSGVYFPFQTDVRTFIVGEGMQIEVGVALGGVSANTKDRNVQFKIDNTLVTSDILTKMKAGTAYISGSLTGVTSLSAIPANYYSLSNSTNMVIKAGQHTGVITIKADSVNFLADPATNTAKYVLPLYIVSADADTILPTKRYAVLGLKYENMLYGNYNHGGVTTIKDASGNIIKTTKYYTVLPQLDAQVWKVTTFSPNTITVTGGYSEVATTKAEMRLTLDGNNITVSNVSGSTKVIQPDGVSTFNRAKLLQNRKLFLNYKYANSDGTTSYAQDTLTFRNRIQDGVNIWQDENPSHYN
jgi:hypothetical protein